MAIQPLFPIPKRFPVPSAEELPAPFLKKLVDGAADEAKDMKTVEGAAKTARDTFDLIAHVKPTAVGTQISSHMGVLAKTYDFLDLFDNGKTTVKNFSKTGGSKEKRAKRILRGTSGILGIITGGMSGFQILDACKILHLSNFTKWMGQIRVIGPYLAAIFPFSSVFGMVEFTRCMINVAASSLELKELSQKIDRVKNKISEKWGSPIDQPFAEKTIEHLDQKQKKLLEDAHQMVQKVEERGDECAQKIRLYADQKAKYLHSRKKLKERYSTTRLFKIIRLKFDLYKAKKASIQVGKAYSSIAGSFNALKKAYDTRQKQLEEWKKVNEKFANGQIGDPENKALETFRNKKIEKWSLKKGNVACKARLEKFSLALSIILAALIFASFVLGFTAIGVMPGFLLACAFVSLVISVGHFTHHLCKKYKSEIPLPVPLPVPVPVPALPLD